jgi:hypothetical protein
MTGPIHARVLDVHGEIRMTKGGELLVTERITVEARAKTAALERDLPHAAQVVDVIRNGHPEPYALENGRLRVNGAPHVGRHLYQISYRSARRIVFLSDHDALHWTLRGGERVTAEVILPAAVPRRQIKVEGNGREYQSFVRDGRAAFRAQQNLSLVVRFPKGVVAEPAIDERARWFFSDYFGAVLIAAMLGLTAWVLSQFSKLSKKGSDPFFRRPAAKRSTRSRAY